MVSQGSMNKLVKVVKHDVEAGTLNQDGKNEFEEDQHEDSESQNSKKNTTI